MPDFLLHLVRDIRGKPAARSILAATRTFTASASNRWVNRLPSPGRHRLYLPTINELEALVDCAAHSPALPSGHPFTDVQDIYGSSTTSLFEPDWAWGLYLENGAIGVGQKRYAQFSVWAVATVD